MTAVDRGAVVRLASYVGIYGGIMVLLAAAVNAGNSERGPNSLVLICAFGGAIGITTGLINASRDRRITGVGARSLAAFIASDPSRPKFGVRGSAEHGVVLAQVVLDNMGAKEVQVIQGRLVFGWLGGPVSPLFAPIAARSSYQLIVSVSEPSPSSSLLIGAARSQRPFLGFGAKKEKEIQSVLVKAVSLAVTAETWPNPNG